MSRAKKIRTFLGMLLTYLVLLFALFILLFPIGWTLATSFKGKAEYFARPPIWIPREPTLENYLFFFKPDIGGGDALANTLIIASSSLILVLILAIPAAYAISRYKVGGETLPTWFLTMRMMPPVAPVLPLFILFFTLGKIIPALGIDHKLPLIIVYTIFNLPFAVWLLMGFFEDFPQEIQEQAMVDGCSEMESLVKVILPIMAPGIVVVALFCFTFAFNEFLFAITLTRGNTRTLMVLLSSFTSSPQSIMYGAVAVTAIISFIPAFILSLFFQQYLVKGLSMGGLKG
jgi:multiple sugar transport system permease protein